MDPHGMYAAHSQVQSIEWPRGVGTFGILITLALSSSLSGRPISDLSCVTLYRSKRKKQAQCSRAKK